jgi:dipeptidyl aminopeptidase/acylaminoacyl peptidase
MLWVLLLLPIGWTADVVSAEISVDVMFQRDKFGAMRLSPDGLHLAAIARLNGRNNLEIIDLQTREAKAITNFDYTDVIQFTWISNKRLILAVGDAEEASGRARFTGWLALDRDGSRVLRLAITSIVGSSPAGGDEVIVTARGRGSTINDLYALDTYTGHTQLLTFDYPGEVGGWIVDRAGVPRVARSHFKGKRTLWYRAGPDSSWMKLDESAEFQHRFTPIAFDYDNKTLYVSATHQDKRAIYTYDFNQNKLGELVAGSPQIDMGALIFSRARKALLGVTYQGAKPGVIWFDPEMAKLQQTVDRALPDTYNALLIAEENPHRTVVVAYSDVDPGTVYLLDTDKSQLELLVKRRPWIDPKQMAERKPVVYKARDGLEIPAYLTLPRDAGDKKPPLVVIIHGGPWVRGNVWGFDTEAEFFASRGYAVLEPEFRGSAGHGWKLLSASFKQWGLAMQDDVTDGVEWLIKEGAIDRDRICLYGGSYGGYATLWGLMKTPELYRCGVAFVAVTDISMLFDLNWDDIRRSDFMAYTAKDIIGDPDKDAEKFKSVSPIYNAEKLKAPVLLAYGGRDNRVPMKHGDQFRAALDKSGKTYEWVVYSQEGHGFNKDENRLDFYRRVDAFLKKYLQ